MATAPGTVLDGKYELLKEIGRGGMSVVYLAMDKRLNKQWAVKEILRQGRDEKNEICIRSLIAEANLMKRLDHPALPRIVDILETEQVIYVVMDYVEGESLGRVLEEYGPQPQDVVIDWIMQLADALNYLHSQKPPIIYRDMKPPNIMLKPEGTVKLIDFGTAREYKGTGKQDTVVLGTPGYAAPEQYMNSGRETDARTDIYALGMTMHQLLTGQDPTASDYEYFPIRHWNPDLHEGIEHIVERCLRPDPDDRFQTCGELMYALENYEVDTIAYRNAQKKKVRLFFTSAALSVALLVTGIGFLIANRLVTNRDYELCLEQSRFPAAIAVDNTRLEAYDRLLESYESFGKEDSDEFRALWAQYAGKKDTEEYLRSCYKIGKKYFHCYQEQEGNDNFQPRAQKSADYFEPIHAALEKANEAGRPLDFKERDIAESYYEITKFYRENKPGELINEHSRGELEALLNAFGNCLQSMDSIDVETEAAHQNIKLDQCRCFANLVNELRYQLKDAGVGRERALEVIEQIRRQLDGITLSELQTGKERCLEQCMKYQANIRQVYGD